METSVKMVGDPAEILKRAPSEYNSENVTDLPAYSAASLLHERT
jgi:hypothetical protein